MDASFLIVKSDDGTEYNLTKPPDGESKFVVEAKEKLTETLQINELAIDLSNVGKFLLMAYCGVMGHADLEKQVRERLYSVTELCDDTVLTLNEFSRASDKAIEIMITAYHYTLEGFEDLAFKMLKDVTKLSKKMVKASSSLYERFAIEAKEVEDVQTQTMGERQKVDDALVETKRCINKHTSDHSFAKDELGKATTEEKQNTEKLNEVTHREKFAEENRRMVQRNFEEKLRELERKLDEADSKLRECINRSRGFFGAVINFFGGKTKEDKEEDRARIDQQSAKRQHEMAREQYHTVSAAENEKVRVLREQRELIESNLRRIQQKREQASRDMAEIAKKLMHCNLEASEQSDSLNCLNHALTALRNLQDIMTIAGNFWRSWVSLCKGFSTDGFTKKIENFSKKDVETWKRFICSSQEFKIEAVRHYSRWVAVQQVCSDSRDSITDAQKKLHNYISQNPTKELGRAILQVLAKEFEHNSKPLAITADQTD